MTIAIDAPAVDPRTIPGAMQDYKRRELPDGAIIEFESAPAGWLTQDGNVRERDWRAYHLTATAECVTCEGTGRVPSVKRPGGTIKCDACKGSGAGKRERLQSVSSVVGGVLPKDGLQIWYEARGIEGAIRAVQLGLVDPHDPASADNAIAAVRAARLGADRARDDAADRGINVHRLLETYMLTGSPPNPADHPPEHYGYLQALTRFLLKYDPEPEEVELLVAHPREGYAGRLDLIARVGGRRVLFDAKTQERCAIYDAAHTQSRLYAMAHEASGGVPVDGVEIVALAADGDFRVMPCSESEESALLALAWWRAHGPTRSACESANRFERQKRAA